MFDNKLRNRTMPHEKENSEITKYYSLCIWWDFMEKWPVFCSDQKLPNINKPRLLLLKISELWQVLKH
jgi:hypothetical protein